MAAVSLSQHLSEPRYLRSATLLSYMSDCGFAIYKGKAGY